jgi:hypothetical protein
MFLLLTDCSLAGLTGGDGGDAGPLDAHRVEASHDAESEHRTDAEAREASVAPFTPIRIACGQPTPITDIDANPWSADEYYVGGTALIGRGTVSGTPSPELYYGQRYGKMSTSFHYTIPLPAGSYWIHMFFSEGYYTVDGGTGEREFNVSINGSVVLSHFDIYAAAGNQLLTAVRESFPVTLADAGSVTLEFDPLLADPLIDAIEITQGSEDAGLSAVRRGSWSSQP